MLNKEAFLGTGLLAGVKTVGALAAPRVATRLAGMATRAGLAPLKQIPNVVMRSAAEAPGATAMSLGFSIPMTVATGFSPTAQQVVQRDTGQHFASQLGAPPMKVGLASSLISEEDRQAAEEYLKKHAAMSPAARIPLSTALGATPTGVGSSTASLANATWGPKQLATMMAVLSGIGVATNVGQEVVNKGLEEISDAAREQTIQKRYKKMLKSDSELEDAPLTRKMFGILDRTAPEITNEPYVAAATVQQMLSTPSMGTSQQPGITPRFLKEVLEVRRLRQDTKPSSKRPAATSPLGVKPYMNTFKLDE